MDTLSRIVDSKMSVEKETTRHKIRLAHLKLQGRTCEDTATVLEMLLGVEHFLDTRIGTLLKQHPGYPWFSKIKGVGPENIAKCIGPIRVKPESGYRKNKETNKVELVPLPFAATISGVWAYTGMGLDKDHKAPKPKEGEPLPYNKELRSMWWRLGSSILKAGLRQKCLGCSQLIGQNAVKEHLAEKHQGQDTSTILFATVGTSEFAKYYLQEKTKYIDRQISRGGKVVPASELPKDATGKKYETEGIISDGHIHNMALRKLIKLFIACLWLVWREAESLPLTKPYALEVLHHSSLIDPWKMCDS